MSALVVVTYLWGNKYSVDDVGKVYRGFKRHLEEPHKFVVITDDEGRFGDSWLGYHVHEMPKEDRPLTTIKGCFARLRLFDSEFQKQIGVNQRLVCVDLDVVVTGPLFPLFARTERFMILKGANAINPCPYNGSLWYLRAGYRPDVWSSFSLKAAEVAPKHEFADDQGWFWHKMPDAPGWNVGPESGVYAFQKPKWPKGDALPSDARIVVFPGWRSPDKFIGLDWVRQHWA